MNSTQDVTSLSNLPTDILRTIICQLDCLKPSMRLISPRWDVIVLEWVRERPQRFPCIKSIFCNGETLKLELYSYLLERYQKRMSLEWRNGASSFKITNSFITIPIKERFCDLEFQYMLRLCSKIYELKVKILHPYTVDVLRFYLGSLKVNELELSNVQFANKIYRVQILDLIRFQRVQHCSIAIVDCDIHAKREFIIKSMATLKYLEIDEFRQHSASNVHSPITHFGKSKEFMCAFVSEDFGSVNVRFHATVDRTKRDIIGVRSRIVVNQKNYTQKYFL